MLQFSKIKFLISFAIFCFLIQNINLTNYIAFQMKEVDDCVRLVNISNNISSKIVINFSLENSACDPQFKVKPGPCEAGNWSLYADENGFLIKDYEYEFMNEIAITFEDWNHQNGFMGIDVFLMNT